MSDDYVRRVTKGGMLAFHRADCRHVIGRDDVEAVTLDELIAALAARRFQRVRFRGRTLKVEPCQECLTRPAVWPQGDTQDVPRTTLYPTD